VTIDAVIIGIRAVMPSAEFKAVEDGGRCPPNLLLKEMISLRILMGFFLFYAA
jgi:hypothetical protein